jgi:engulfment/cell motility protein 1
MRANVKMVSLCVFLFFISGNRMTSKEAENDLETLLSMDIKLRLLDAEGIDIPQEPPAIPELPPNYDFCYELK